MSANARILLCLIFSFAQGVIFAKPPNFIVILTDDQGWGTTSVMIDPDVPKSKSDFFQTPNLEKLASQSMRFTQGYAAHPNCSPSRAALLTGRSPAALHFTDIVGRDSGPTYEGNKIIPPQHINDLPLRDVTLPELLKQERPEYQTAHFGKWHLGNEGPEKHGFDTSDGNTGNGNGSRKGNLPDDPKLIFGVTKRASDWMEQQVKSNTPFYLQVSHYATHLPNQSLPATTSKFSSLEPGERHQNIPFGAMLNDLDTGIGQLMEKVNELGIGDNTYIFYTADNGSLPTDDIGNINGPVRGSKATVWEGGVRVPFMVAGPGIEPASINRTPVVGYDIYPTICDILDISSIPELVEGGSLLPILRGTAKYVQRSQPGLVFHWPHYVHGKNSVPHSTILLDGFKLHYFWETGNTELFNLDKDLAEQTNLSKFMPEKAEKLEAMLHTSLDQVNAQIPVVNPHYDPATDPALVRKKN